MEFAGVLSLLVLVFLSPDLLLRFDQCYCSSSELSGFNPLKFLWCLTAFPFLNKQRKLHTLKLMILKIC